MTLKPNLDLSMLGVGDGPEGPRGPRLVDWFRFLLGAVSRRRLLAIRVLALVLVGTYVYYRVRTPVYRVEAKILAQRQQALPSIARPAGLDDTPTRSATELVRRRENLVGMIKQTNLLEGLVRPAPGLMSRLFGTSTPPEDDDPLDALVMRLDHALRVTTGDGTISIEIDWPEPQQAYRLVEAAVQNFLETRHLQEVTTIDESISLLQARTETLRGDLERAIDEARRNRPRVVVVREPEARASAVPTRAETQNEQLVALRSMLEAKERAIRDVEEFRRRRLADLQAQLETQRGVYSDAHPSIISLRRDIDALSRDSPQITALREDERRLRQEYNSRLPPGETHLTSPVAAAPLTRTVPGSQAEEPERVRDARFQFQRMVERLTAARVELDAARAAFKYRYNVIWPAQVPKEPHSPDPRLVFGFGAFLAVALSLFAAGLVELWPGKVVERWQVERSLDLPVLAELTRD
jgi:uncharacterized protein involved in exopolysaccharide biosynthesis